MANDDLQLTAKPAKRGYRIGIFGPIVFVLILALGWTAYWFYVANRMETALASNRDALIKAGYQVSYDPLHVRGFPYRMYFDFHKLTVIAPSGRGFMAPQLRAEANAYALDKWVAQAPAGLTLYRGRPGGYDLGSLAVTARSLKASVSHLTQPVWNVAFEGVGLTLTPSDPSHPFVVTSAESFDAYMRPAVSQADGADFLIRLTGGQGAPGSLAGNLAPGKKLNLQTEMTVDHISQFQGRNFASSVDAWKAAGGQAKAFKSQVVAGDLTLFATSDALALDPDSHVRGKMNIELSGTFQPVTVLGALHLISQENMTLAAPLLNLSLSTQGKQSFPLDFKDGGAYIGGLKVSNAPILP